MSTEPHTVLVTGASRGIGRAIALRFAKSGARVAVTARTADACRDLEREHPKHCRAWRLDVRERGEVDRVVGEIGRVLGRIDVIVNNAGIAGHTPIDDDDDTRWNDIVATNLTGPMLVTRAALPFISSPGRIINISSVLGKFGVARMGAYCASKHGLIGWTRALALELAPREITVNAICPGWVDTDMADSGVRETAEALGVTPEEFRRRAVEAVPQKRFLDADEVANLVFYVASPQARGMTGQALSICAGQTIF